MAIHLFCKIFRCCIVALVCLGLALQLYSFCVSNVEYNWGAFLCIGLVNRDHHGDVLKWGDFYGELSAVGGIPS